jgi:hypothetical protein
MGIPAETGCQWREGRSEQAFQSKLKPHANNLILTYFCLLPKLFVPPSPSISPGPVLSSLFHFHMLFLLFVSFPR